MQMSFNCLIPYISIAVQVPTFQALGEELDKSMEDGVAGTMDVAVSYKSKTPITENDA